MKKTVKSILVIALMAVMTLSLAGCGKKEDKKAADAGDKLVAEKEVANGGSTMGEKKEIIEVSFKDGKADKVVMKMEFEDESTPSSYASLLAAAGDQTPEGMEVKAEGKCIVMTMDASTYMAKEGENSEELTKDNIKKALEDEGFTIK